MQLNATYGYKPNFYLSLSLSVSFSLFLCSDICDKFGVIQPPKEDRNLSFPHPFPHWGNLASCLRPLHLSAFASSDILFQQVSHEAWQVPWTLVSCSSRIYGSLRWLGRKRCLQSRYQMKRKADERIQMTVTLHYHAGHFHIGIFSVELLHLHVVFRTLLADSWKHLI